MFKSILVITLLVLSSFTCSLKLRGIAVADAQSNTQGNAIAENGGVSAVTSTSTLGSNALNIGSGSAYASGAALTTGNAYSNGINNVAMANANSKGNANAISNQANTQSTVQSVTASTASAVPATSAGPVVASSPAPANGNCGFLIDLNLGLLQTISVNAGVGFNIMLPGAPMTGYAWVLDQPSLLNLNLIAALNLNLLNVASDIINTSVQIGVAANYNFKFNAVAHGLVTLKFLYKQPNMALAPLKILTLNVNIL